jgi:hypothetical protein
MNPLDTVVAALLTHGIPGCVIVVLGWWVYRKDAELSIERRARIEDARSYSELSLKLQAQVIEAVNKLSAVFDEVKKLVQKGGYR